MGIERAALRERSVERHLRGCLWLRGWSRLACSVRPARTAQRKAACPAPARLLGAAVCALHAGGLCTAVHTPQFIDD